MEHQFLDFEKPIVDLQAKIEALRHVSSDDSAINISKEISSLEKQCESLIKSVYSNLDPWQVSQLSRHPKRPHAVDYLSELFEDFDELHGDRHFGDDRALIGGLACIDDKSVMVIAQEKGRSVAEKLQCNFAMPRPEGYRKALRLMELAERFKLPIISLIDTPGAYPGIGAEERGQSEAIATNLLRMSQLKVPVISVVIGEGGSGGALAIGVADRVLMLQYSTYSVISPEGCASILWKDAAKAPDAAKALGLTAENLLKLKLVDSVIPEPLGGAHRDAASTMSTLKQFLLTTLSELESIPASSLVAQRYDKFMRYGIPIDPADA